MSTCEYLGNLVQVEAIEQLGGGRMGTRFVRRHKCTLKKRWSCIYEGIEHLCPLRNKTKKGSV